MADIGDVAALWSPSRTATAPKAVGGLPTSEAFAVNACGQSMGYSSSHKDIGQDAALWAPSCSQAGAINASGQSIGYSKTTSGGTDAGLWSSSGRATAPADPGDMGVADAVAINASGHSVGSAETTSGNLAPLGSKTGEATNLAAVSGSASSDTQAGAIDIDGGFVEIDNAGVFSLEYNAAQYGILLTAVGPLSAAAAPELSTWGMIALGFAGLGLAGYRRMRADARPL
jgi:hypothetical protein